MGATKQYFGLAIALWLVFWIFSPAVTVFIGIAFAMVCKPEPSFVTKKVSSETLVNGGPGRTRTSDQWIIRALID